MIHSVSLNKCHCHSKPSGHITVFSFSLLNHVSCIWPVSGMLEEIWFHPEHGWKNSSDRKILSIPPCLSTGRVQATHFSSCHRDDYIHINQKVFSRIWTVLLQLLSMGRSLKEKTEVQGVARPAVFTEVESQCR